MKTACEETKYQGRNHVFSAFVIPEDAVSRFCRNDKSHLEVWGSAVVPRISELSSLQHTRREPPTPAHKLMPSSLFLSVVPVATFDPIGLFYMSLRNTVLRSGNIR